MPDVENVRFSAPDGPELEGRLAVAKGARGAAVLCHPHPQYEGSMSSAIIPALQRALTAAGWASLRFNFRGVGRSAGTYDGGKGETDDARAALAYVADAVPGAPLALAGWSFGALVGLSAAVSDDRVVAYAGIAPPVSWSATGDLPPEPSEEALRAWRARILLVCGTEDPFCRPPGLKEFASRVAPRAEIRVFDGQDHFFSTARDELARAVAAFIAGDA